MAKFNNGEVVTLFNHDFAVLIFFIISGYYMTMVLSTKDAYRHYVTFIKSRYLRLYPLYFITLVLTLCLIPIIGNGAEVLKACTSSGRYVTFSCTVSSLTLVGLDGFPWLTFYPVWTGNFIPQAWSIGSEILFYLVIPFLFARKRLLVLLLALGLVSNYLWHNHHIWNTTPKNYYLFYYYFFFGAVSYHYVKPFLIEKKHARIALPLLVAFLLGYGIFPVFMRTAIANNYFWYTNLTAAVVALVLPSLFSVTKNDKLDRFIGDLSYPVYILHILVMNVTRYFMPNPLHADGSRNYSNHVEIILIVVVTVLLAIAYDISIGERIENYRHKTVVK